MAKIVIGVFDDISLAQRAADALLATGVHRSKVSLAEDATIASLPRTTRQPRKRGSALAVGLGTVLGGYWGHAIGVGVGFYGMAAPELGHFGWLTFAACLATGAVVGAGAGGAVGTVAGLNWFPEDTRTPVVHGPPRPGARVTVHAVDDVAVTTGEFFEEHGAIDVEVRDVATTAPAKNKRKDPSVSED